MTRRGVEPGAFADGDLVHHLLLDWRSRCATMSAAWELTTGRSALSLCVAVVRTLEHGYAVPELALAMRTWGAGVPSAADARSALQCLGQSVSELSASGFGDFRVRGLDPVLEALAQEAVIPMGRRNAPVDIDELTRCPLRASLTRDLTTAVTAAGAASEGLTLAVLELDGGRAGRQHLGGRAVNVEDSQLLALLGTIRRTFGGREVYRVGKESFAVLAPGVGAVGMGELVLQATCIVGPKFHWGTASLRSAVPTLLEAPDLLLPLAEADLHVRREDMVRASTTVVRHKHVSLAGAAAAALLVLAAIGLTFRGGPSEPTSTTLALASPALAAPHRVSSPGPTTTAPPAQVQTPTPPAQVQTTPPPAPPPPAAPPSQNAVLTTSQTPPPPAAPPPGAPPPGAPPPAASPPPVPSPTVQTDNPEQGLLDELLAILFHHAGHIPHGSARHLLS